MTALSILEKYNLLFNYYVIPFIWNLVNSFVVIFDSGVGVDSECNRNGGNGDEPALIMNVTVRETIKLLMKVTVTMAVVIMISDK